MKSIFHQVDNRKKYCTAMVKAPPGKYLFLTANMIAVSVCKHSQDRYMTIFVNKGHCHLLMASKNKYQMYQWTRPKVTPDFVLDRYTYHRVSPCRRALLIRSDYRWSNLLWATSALLQHLPVDILKGRRPWTSWSARRTLIWTWDRCKTSPSGKICWATFKSNYLSSSGHS